MGPIETKVIEEKKPQQEELPPPPPQLKTPPPYVPPPDLNVALPPPTTSAPSTAITNISSKPTPPPPPKPSNPPHFDPHGRWNRFPDSEYPSQSRRLGEEGKVTLAVLVMPDNSIGDIKVAKSSGYERLDHAALEWYRKRGRFLAATTKDGKPIADWMTFVVTFQLR